MNIFLTTLRTGVFLFCLAGGSLISPRAIAADYVQNFEGLSPGSSVPGWIGSKSTTWADQAQFVVTTNGATSGSNAFGQMSGTNQLMLYTAGVPQADGDMRWTETTIGESGSFIGGALRFDATGSNGYIADALYSPTGVTVYFNKVVSGSRIQIGNRAGYPIAISGIVAGTKVIQHFTVSGETLSYRVYLAGMEEPAPITLEDASIHSPGYYGFYISGMAGMAVDDVRLAGAGSLSAEAIGIGNSHIFYSPGNWYSNGTGAMTANNIRSPVSGAGSSTFIQTQNQGAYLKTVFGGTSFALIFDPAPLIEGNIPKEQWPMLRYYIDGVRYDDVQLPASGTNLPLASGLTPANHTLTLYTLRLKQSGDKWGTVGASPANVFRLTGLTLDEGAALFSPHLMPGRALYFGDSITDGVRAVGIDADFTGMDGTTTTAQLVGQALNCEIGIIGYGGQAWVNNGNGNAPGFLSAWNFYHNGAPRDFTQPLDYLIENEGANGGSSATNTAAWTSAARALGTAGRMGEPTKIICISAFNGNGGADLTEYRAANPSDDQVFSVDGGAANEGLLSDPRFSPDNLHPSNEGHIWLSSRLSALIRAALDSSEKPR